MSQYDTHTNEEIAAIAELTRNIPVMGDPFVQVFTEEGLLPPDCVSVELFTPRDGVMSLRYECYVQKEDLPKILRALKKTLL